MSVELQDRLRDFTKTALERRGALVEWPAEADEGWAMLPPDLAARFENAELLRLSHNIENAGLCVNLATDYLERIAPLVETEARVGLLQIPEMYLKKSTMDEPVSRAFTWMNVKVKVKETEALRMEYHAWSFLATLNSEDTWEDLIQFTLNATSGAEIAMPDALGLDAAQPYTPAVNGIPDTLSLARRRAAAHVETRAAPFIARLESRLARDHKRLREYYNALLKETKDSWPRDDDEQKKLENKRRAVELELRRKISELEERYVLRVMLAPLTLIRLELPVLAVQCEIFRKQARKLHTLYWNPVLTALEPMRCSMCGASIFAVTFTDDEVLPLCSVCAK
ncbi:MAG: hypothetical protein V1899_07105 [Planctomycetota bacterium]